MKPILVAVLLASTAAAQIHGAPASALSLGSGPQSSHGFGVPASAMSLGPNGYGNSRWGTVPRRDFSRDLHRDFRGPRGPVVGFPVYSYPIVPYYGLDYGYAEPQPAPADTTSNANSYDAGYAAGSRAYDAGYADALRSAQSRVAQPAAAPEPDDRYGEHYLDSRESSGVSVSRGQNRVAPSTGNRVAPPPSAEQRSEAAPIHEGPTTVLIYKDGHRAEIRNYAIIGQTLWDLSGGVTRKIPLADIDLDATSKENDSRGLDFKLPKRT